MEYRLGTALKIKDGGKTLSLKCPNCGNKVGFSVFSNAESRLSSKFPFFKRGNVYFLVCRNALRFTRWRNRAAKILLRVKNFQSAISI